MKIRYYGALTSAFLLTLSTGSASAGDCGCPHKPVHHAAVHHVTVRPAPVREETADAEYAQSYYDYHSSSTVTEAQESREDYKSHHREWARGAHGHWVVAPNDARIRFHSYMYDVNPPNGVVGMNDNDFTGGVGGGYGEAYADSYSGGYRDGYGQMHFGPGENGPTYGENFGGFRQGGYGAERGGVWHGYNMQGGPGGNGY